jgi:hypothetical protein
MNATHPADPKVIDEHVTAIVENELRYLASRSERDAAVFRGSHWPKHQRRAAELAEIGRRWQQLADDVANGRLAQLDYDAANATKTTKTVTTPGAPS